MSTMLCCGGEKESARDLKSAQNTPSRQPMQPPYPGPGHMQPLHMQQQPHQMGQIGPQHQMGPPPLSQGLQTRMPGQPLHMNMAANNYDHQKDDYRKGTGIPEEVFRQIETVQNRYDSSTAAAFRAVQKSGEMVVRTLDPRQFIRLASETAPKINIDTNDPDSVTSFVEIVKRPGQTLGLYIREGNGIDRGDGVFISRIAPESSVYNSGCLQIGDEILAVNLVDVTRMSLDDVVIIMSIPRRLVLTTRRSRSGSRYGQQMAGGRLNGDGGGKGVPVVVFKGGQQNSHYRGDSYDGMDSPGRGGRGGDYMPYRDSRTLTWDRNPKPDRNDPKYFPVNSLPRHSNNRQQASAGSATGVGGTPASPGMRSEESMHGMPPPMRELNTVSSGWSQGQPRNGGPGGGGYPQAYYSPSGGAGGGGGGGGGGTSEYYHSESEQAPGRGQRLLHRMASEGYGRRHGGVDPAAAPEPDARRGYSTLQYPHQQGSRQYPRTHNGGGPMASGGGRTRHYSGLDYASDTEALQSPVLSARGGVRPGTRAAAAAATAANMSSALAARSSSLPRTFQREALLRHPELSMEMDRLASPSLAIQGLPTDEPLSDSGVISAPENMLSARKRGYRSPSSISAIGGDTMGGRAAAMYGYKDLRRTPSTSAIYETLRRSKELRESLTSRPSSRLSIDNIPDKLRGDTDAQYFSDSEHQLVSGSMASHHRMGGDIHRRIRNRTLTGLETMRISDHLRPGSAQGRPITPSFTNDKDPGQQFVDFNPADFIKYKSECDPESTGIRLSGMLSLHLLSGRGLRTGGRSRRIRDLYCVVEVDHIHKARTVVRSGGVNFDWDEKFELDLANNLEVEFLVYSWDPQLRHRLCYRSSLRLAALFGKGQTFQQVALRMHPAGTLYLTLRYTDLREAYDRSRNPAAMVVGTTPRVGISPLGTVVPPHVMGRGVKNLFGCILETVLEREASGFLVPLIVKRCTDEVEKRGLDIIGIYRLCGSETKKRMLRDAFEESPDLVDLSSENVPDINVITGLLKEYLRELPEPVFSNCLYQMLVDAMGVFLPDDPDGNAKLVFSILDCLPKANRNCLVHIMDHLSRVTSQSSRNKMNPQNLAICFAPVLMMDFSQNQPVAANISEPIQILKYLIEIWPKNQDGL